MKINKILATVILCALGTATFAEDKLTIRFGTEAGYKPFMFKDSDGGLQGFDYDIGNAICEEMKAKCEWVEQDWDGIIPGLLAKKYDGILASMAVTAERQNVVSFTRPYYVAAVHFVGRADIGLDDKEGLAGKTVGVQRGTTQAFYLLNNRTDVTVREYPSQEEIWLDLAAGRIDASFASALVIKSAFLDTDAGAGFSLFGQPYVESDVVGDGVAIAMRKQDSELRDGISAAIEAIHANGTYAEINAKYFDFSIWKD